MSAKPVQLFAIEQKITHWIWDKAPPNITLDDLLDPATWQHVQSKLLPGFHITVQPEGLPWEAELVVLDSGIGYAKVRLLRQTMLNEPGEVPATVYVRWNGPTHKYTIFRKADDVVLNHGHTAIADAEDWARRHVTAMAA